VKELKGRRGGDKGMKGRESKGRKREKVGKSIARGLKM